ncbi:MAG: ribosome biogenesis GTPase Der [Nitrospirota bacterium]|jgi:GTP-binding protein
MPKPVLVIVGRPNVGKSTLFNRIVGFQAAIVEDVPGVTRDRNYMEAHWEDRAFVVVDTGGFYTRTPDNIFEQIKEQALFAIDEADVIVHVLDGKEGLSPFDTELADILRASGKRVLWAVNKVDGPTKEDRLYDFYSLGVGEPVAVSAATGYNFDELMDRVASELPATVEPPAEYPKIAVVGRPNVGKSTLINSLLGKKRLLVSAEAGTTRDSVDTLCTYYGKKYLLVDTAGIRRKHRLGYSLERFALIRAMRSIERCDVALVLLDASEGVMADDQKIAGMVHRNQKGAVFLLNKFDLVEEPEASLKTLRREMERKLWFFSHAPVLTTSGLTRKRVTKVFPAIDEVLGERAKRIGTAELNRFMRGITPPSYRGKAVKLRYLTQVASNPPVFALFANKPEGIKESFVRHLESRLRESYSFKGVPIRIHVRQST